MFDIFLVIILSVFNIYMGRKLYRSWIESRQERKDKERDR